MQQIISPISRSANTSIVKSIKAVHIINSYKAFGIDVSRYFDKIKNIIIYRCNDIGYEFYYPYQTAGDSSFYEHFQTFEWYYMPWKWEHEITKQYLSSGMNVLEVGCVHGAFLKKITELFDLRSAVGLKLNETT